MAQSERESRSKIIPERRAQIFRDDPIVIIVKVGLCAVRNRDTAQRETSIDTRSVYPVRPVLRRNEAWLA